MDGGGQQPTQTPSPLEMKANPVFGAPAEDKIEAIYPTEISFLDRVPQSISQQDAMLHRSVT